VQQRNTNDNELVLCATTLKELAELLIKKNKLHEGRFDLSIEFQIAVGGVGPTPETVVPGAMIGVKRIGLLRTELDGPHTVDASIVNPKKIAVRKK
jgi:hypothetical protein